MSSDSSGRQKVTFQKKKSKVVDLTDIGSVFSECEEMDLEETNEGAIQSII